MHEEAYRRAAAEAGTTPLPTGSAEDLADPDATSFYFAHVGARSEDGVSQSADLNLDVTGDPVVGAREHDELHVMSDPQFAESGHEEWESRYLGFTQGLALLPPGPDRDRARADPWSYSATRRGSIQDLVLTRVELYTSFVRHVENSDFAHELARFRQKHILADANSTACPRPDLFAGSVALAMTADAPNAWETWRQQQDEAKREEISLATKNLGEDCSEQAAVLLVLLAVGLCRPPECVEGAAGVFVRYHPRTAELCSEASIDEAAGHAAAPVCARTLPFAGGACPRLAAR